MQTRRNMCRLDQVLRTGIGALLIYVGWLHPSLVGDELLAHILAIFGILNVIAAVTGWCPVYQVAGICTRSEPASTQPQHGP